MNATADCATGRLKIVVTQALHFNGAIGLMLAALLLGLVEIEIEFCRENLEAVIEESRKAER